MRSWQPTINVNVRANVMWW